MTPLRKGAPDDDHSLAVWFTPHAIREHYEGTGNESALAGLEDEDLAGAAADALLTNDPLWDMFNDICHDIVTEATRRKMEREANAAPKGGG
jgi:hypothetical protein